MTPKEEDKYKCGHKGETIILDSNLLSITAWLEWKDTVGFDGDKSMCFNCWCKNEKDKDIEKVSRKEESINRKVNGGSIGLAPNVNSSLEKIFDKFEEHQYKCSKIDFMDWDNYNQSKQQIMQKIEELEKKLEHFKTVNNTHISQRTIFINEYYWASGYRNQIPSGRE